MIDCFGDPKVTGKVGTDITNKKCTWLIVQALPRANSKQRAILEVEKEHRISVHNCIYRKSFNLNFMIT